MQQNMCEICFYGETKIVEGMTHTKIPIPCKRLSIFCNYNMSYKGKWVKLHDCGNYRPKAGKIGKNIYQTTF